MSLFYIFIQTYVVLFVICHIIWRCLVVLLCHFHGCLIVRCLIVRCLNARCLVARCPVVLDSLYIPQRCGSPDHTTERLVKQVMGIDPAEWSHLPRQTLHHHQVDSASLDLDTCTPKVGQCHIARQVIT